MARSFERVAVLKGGISSEREVSLDSGAAIARGLREGGYEVEEIDQTGKELQIPETVEAVFIALHGTFGEDGAVQALLEEREVAYTGSRPDSSALSFDKAATRAKLHADGIPVPPGELVPVDGTPGLPLPLVVKPPREGSSVGCHLVFKDEELAPALADVRTFSDDVLVETYIPGRELTVGVVMGEVLPAVEIVPAEGWYDFQSKYMRGDTCYKIPAELDADITNEVERLTRCVYHSLGAQGFGRVDFRLSPEGQLYVLELNSIPGFTANSLLPKAAEAAGIGFSELCCRIMESAHL